MPKVQHLTNTEANAPAWCADYRSRDHLIPAPMRLDAAQFTADANGRRYVPSGTYVGRTYAERDANTGFGPAAAADDEQYLIAFPVSDATNDPTFTAVRGGTVVKENYLPGFAALAADIKASIRATYRTITGAA